MTEFWKDYWKLMEDPFSEEPLSYYQEDLGNLLVETRSIQKAQRLAHELEAFTPRIHRVYIVGERGMGKSTVMNFLAWKFFQALPGGRVLPIYVSTLAPGKTASEVGANFLRGIISQIFSTIVLNAPKLGLVGTQTEKFFKDRRRHFFDSYDKIDTQVGLDVLSEYLDHLEGGGFARFAVLFDELDRFENQKLFLEFLGRYQGVFETLAKHSVVFFMAGIPDWIHFLKADEYSGMRGETIELTAWSPEDAYRLVSSRFKRSCTVATKNPLTPSTMEFVTKQADGRPRQILSLTRTLLTLGASQRVDMIDEKFCDSFLWRRDAVDLFRMELNKNDSALRGATKLRRGFDPSRDDPIIYKVLSAIVPLGKLQTDVSTTAIRKDYGLDMETRSFWNVISILENTKLIRRVRPHNRREFYEMDPDLASLFALAKKLGESIEFLPYAVSLMEREVGAQYEHFNAKIAVTRSLNRAPERSFTVDDLTREILDDPGTREAAVRSMRSAESGEQHVYQKVRRAVVQGLDTLKKGGLVQVKTKEGTSSYRWFPKHLDWKQFEGLGIDEHALQGLEAAEMSFSRGMYDPSTTLCRTVVEKATRRLYETWKGEKCPRNWGLDELNNELNKSKVYDRKVHAKILGLLQQTNPIVHGEVTDVGERYARIVIELSQEAVKDIYSILSEMRSKSQVAPTLAEQSVPESGSSPNASDSDSEGVSGGNRQGPTGQ